MTTIIRLNAIAARRIAEKFSPAKIGSARSCKSITRAISQLISRRKLRCSETNDSCAKGHNVSQRQICNLFLSDLIHFETIVSFVGVVRIWESQAVEELHAPL